MVTVVHLANEDNKVLKLRQTSFPCIQIVARPILHGCKNYRNRFRVYSFFLSVVLWVAGILAQVFPSGHPCAALPRHQSLGSSPFPISRLKGLSTVLQRGRETAVIQQLLLQVHLSRDHTTYLAHAVGKTIPVLHY